MPPLTGRITALAAEFHFSVPSSDVSIAIVSKQGVDDRKDIGVGVGFANSSSSSIIIIGSDRSINFRHK